MYIHKGTFMHRINDDKKNKYFVYLLITYFVVFGVIAAFRFPYTAQKLSLIENGENLITSDGQMSIVDVVKTANMTSVHFLLKGVNQDYYIVTAIRFPFWKRYDMSKLMSMSDEEIYEYSDYFNKVTITREGETLIFSEERHIALSVFTCPFILFTIVCNIIYDCKKQKKK